MRLGLYDWAIAWDRRRGEAWLAARVVDGDADRMGARIRDVLDRVDALARGEVPAARADVRVRHDGGIDERIPAVAPDAPAAFVSGTTRAAWIDGVEAVRAAIGRGEIYQANLTRRLEAPFAGDPWPLFRRLRTGDPALFAGYLDLGPSPAAGTPRALLSASPEPFLAVDAGGPRQHRPDQGHAAARPDARAGPGARPRAARERARTRPRT